VSLPAPLLPAEPTLFSLTNLAITASAADRAKYLQGQVTCDVNALQPGQSTLGGHCDPKGKLWSDFRLLCLEDSLLMLTKPSCWPASCRSSRSLRSLPRSRSASFRAA
jgi:folate-binding Fe-S cluster repair protein YgfZ